MYKNNIGENITCHGIAWIQKARIISSILKIEWLLYKRVMVNRLINVAIWSLSWLCINSYFLPLTHANASMAHYGPFMFTGLCAAVGYFEIYSFVVEIISDVENACIMTTYATLPINFVTALLVRNFLFPVLVILLVTTECMLLGSLFIKNITLITQAPTLKLLAIMISLACAIASFSFLIATFIPSRSQLSNVWVRFIFPLWFFGCFHFSWKSLNAHSPFISYINLFNPMVYAMEGWRSVLLNQENYLPHALCCSMLVVTAFLCAFIGIRRRLKSLDVVM